MTANAYEQRIRRLAKACDWKLEKSRRDGTWQLHRNGQRLKHPERDSHGLSLAQIDRWLQANEPKAAPRVLSPLAAELQAAIDANPGTDTKSWLVLSGPNDPYALDTPANHANGAWLRDVMASLGDRRLHDRGVHYLLVSGGARVAKPNGEIYTNTEANWTWLLRVINGARWLGYVRFDQISDRKNAAGVFRINTAVVDDGGHLLLVVACLGLADELVDRNKRRIADQPPAPVDHPRQLRQRLKAVA
jgi:hypothetical protein